MKKPKGKPTKNLQPEGISLYRPKDTLAKAQSESRSAKNPHDNSLPCNEIRPQNQQQEPLRVSVAEAEQKLMAFLARRVDAPTSMLHKWIRSGQVRVNGARVKPFHRIALDDRVRVPPFALVRPLGISSGSLLVHSLEHTFEDSPVRSLDNVSENPSGVLPNNVSECSSHTLHKSVFSAPDADILPLPPSLYEDEHILLLHKPAGLPVHLGTGHTDSVSTRLHALYKHCAFVPAPAHRLDKDTSGILAVGKTYIGLRSLQDIFARRTPFKTSSSETLAQICGHDTNGEKIYLAWLCGACPWSMPTNLDHVLAKRNNGGYERVEQAAQGQHAHSIVTCLRTIEAAGQRYSLVRVQLLTGRTHQIRAQMAIMGFPVLGDRRYGGTAFPIMLLHAYALILPQGHFEILPTWPKPFSIESLRAFQV